MADINEPYMAKNFNVVRKNISKKNILEMKDQERKV